MDRTDEYLIPPQTSWLVDVDAQAVCAAVVAGGYNIYFVGGCVRNALLSVPDSDVDMSTNARPDQVMALAKAAGFKAIPTGIDHGTITVVSRGKPYEVTTFRRDVATDGRRAVVAFSDDIADDARRRDFTMNALYAAPDGKLIDPLGGLPDLMARKIRFIEDPVARIQEDYLRILRFFRFSAWYAAEDGFDPDALNAIAQNTSGLETLSAERIGQEMIKLLSAPDPVRAIAVMRQTGVLGIILPGSDDKFLGPMIHLEHEIGQPLDWRARLAILGGENLTERLRLSRVDAKSVSMFQDLGFAGPPAGEVAYHHGAGIAHQVVLIRAAFANTQPDSAVFQDIAQAADAVFPLSAADLMPAYQGPALGARLKMLEQVWIDAGFSLTRADLLNQG